MILQTLARYYERRTAGSDTALAPPGFERKEIPFVVVLERDGTFAGLQDTREPQGKKLVARSYTVPQAVKRTVGVRANLLWDNAGYVFAADAKGNAARAAEQHAAFVAGVRELLARTEEDEGVAAVLRFLEAGDFAPVLEAPAWPEIAAGANVSFRLAREEVLVAQRPAVMAALAGGEGAGASPADTVCLVTGEPDEIATLHPAIKGVWGAQSSGANIVSFNLAAFTSHGKEQGANAPVGQRAAFAYTTALNHLLGKGSRQRMQVADASVVFWAEEESELENLFADFFAEPPRDDPDRGTEAVRALYQGPETGAPPLSGDLPFYVLGLAPNAARISVRFWYPGTVGEVAEKLRQHFRDIKVDHAAYEPEFLSLFRLLLSTAPLGKAENVRPNLAAAVFQSVLTGARYPRELLAAAVGRARAERQVTYPRAALLRAWLARDRRLALAEGGSPSTPTEAPVALDTQNSDIGYRLGRLFAALERAQETASPGLNATIRERFYGAASTTPVTVFPRLLKLKNHHVAKIESRGAAVRIEKLIGEIADGIGAEKGFPPLLRLPEQGMFALGYYHQRQDFFTRKDKDTGDDA